MFLTPHAIAGIYIGSQVSNVWLAFMLGIISHLILDFIPHGDEGLADNWTRSQKIKRLSLFVAIEMLIIVLMTYLLISQKIIDLTPTILAGLIGSILPDYIWGFHEITHDRISGWISSKILNGIHHLLPIKLPFAFGIFIQLGTLAIFLFLLLN